MAGSSKPASPGRLQMGHRLAFEQADHAPSAALSRPDALGALLAIGFGRQFEQHGDGAMRIEILVQRGGEASRELVVPVNGHAAGGTSRSVKYRLSDCAGIIEVGVG